MQQTLTWADMAEWWDKKQGDTGDLWHRALIDPTVLAVIGNVKGKRILDLACGNGYFSRKLAKLGAKVTGVDSSPIVQRNIAGEKRKPLGIQYHVLDANELRGMRTNTFDLVLCNMALMDMPDAEGAIREASRVLKKGGSFVASISHPCFDTGSDSAWLVEKIPGKPSMVFRKVSNYRRPHEVLIIWKDGDKRWNTVLYHRPLSWYFQAFNRVNLSVTRFEEPSPTEEFFKSEDQAQWIEEFPLQCVFEAIKR